ncbi:GlcNAc-PI de-N-acetylase [Brachybacterium sp. P6-10-X1]|nr:GlcNAc-PI de-N-acetylase [Brachybacterium sp. P6-10-X1]
MSPDPWQLLEDASTALIVHAHPDDESLSTGALLAALSAAGTRIELVTATRGEEGEVVPGAIAGDEERPLELIRQREIDAAVAHLGLAARHLLGTPPALAPGVPPRHYRDSGMRWIREGLAGPSPSAGPDSFTHRPLEDATDDLVALIEHLRPDVVIGYDDEGTYGHPDHVRAHHVTAAACARSGTVRLEVSSAPKGSVPATGGFSWREHPGTAEVVRAAADSYRTQLTVLGTDDEGIRIRHVGGQDDVIALRTGLRVSA